MLNAYFEKVYKQDQSTFFASITEDLKAQNRRFVVTANPETLMIGEKNAEFDAVLLKESTTIVPDGIGVVKGAEMLGYEMHGRVTGVELCAHLFCAAHELGKSVYLYGAKQEVLSALCERLEREFPGAVVLGAKNGYDFDSDEVFEDICEKRPDVVLVALGIPRQELLIDRYLERFDKGIFVGVGGSFDVLSGKVSRAPKLFVKLNLEWLWRIVRDPKRIRRFYESNVKYLAKLRALKKD